MGGWVIFLELLGFFCAWLAGWLLAWLACLFVGWLFGWLARWFVWLDCLFDCLARWFVGSWLAFGLLFLCLVWAGWLLLFVVIACFAGVVA